MRMVKLLRKMINDRANLPDFEQRRLVNSILWFLRDYEQPSDCRETSLREMSDIQKSKMPEAYGSALSPKLYERFLEINLQGV